VEQEESMGETRVLCEHGHETRQEEKPNASLLLSFETIPGLREAGSGYAGCLVARECVRRIGEPWIVDVSKANHQGFQKKVDILRKCSDSCCKTTVNTCHMYECSLSYKIPAGCPTTIPLDCRVIVSRHAKSQTMNVTEPMARSAASVFHCLLKVPSRSNEVLTDKVHTAHTKHGFRISLFHSFPKPFQSCLQVIFVVVPPSQEPLAFQDSCAWLALAHCHGFFDLAIGK
jgi:hypothetical protein